MRALTVFLAFLIMLASGLSTITISGNQSDYNPSDQVSLNFTEDDIGVLGSNVNVYFDNGTAVLCNSSNYQDIGGSYIALINCTMPTYLVNGTWNITAHNVVGSDASTTTQFILNSTNMTVTIASPSFQENGTFSYNISTTLWIGTPFNVNVNYLHQALNVSPNFLSCTTPANISSTSVGQYNSTCTIGATVNATDYLLNISYPNSNGSGAFTIDVTYHPPLLSANTYNIFLDYSNTSNVTIVIDSRSNINDTLNIGVSGCDAVNLDCTIYSSLPSNQTTIDAYGEILMNISVSAIGTNGTHVLTVNVSRWNDNSNSSAENITVTVNPIHNFTFPGPATGTGSVAAGGTIPYTFQVHNVGNSTKYNFSCASNNSKFTCAFNTSNNSVTVPYLDTMDVNVSVTVSASASLGEMNKINVTVTDSYDLSQMLAGTYFTTNTSGIPGNVSVMNVSQYPHFPGEVFYFNISVNNSGNDNVETLYNITISAKNPLGNWSIWVSNVSDFSANNYTVNDSQTANLTLHITALSSNNVSVGVIVPVGVTSLNSTYLYIKAISATNSSRFSANSTVLIKLPQVTFALNMTYNITNTLSGIENLTFVLSGVTREPGVSLTQSFLNYTITLPNGSLANITSVLNMGTTYLSNTSNKTNWPAGKYGFNITGNSTSGYNMSFNGAFYLGRWAGIAISPTSLSGVVYNTYFTTYVTTTFENTSLLANETYYSGAIPMLVFNFNGGSSCAQTGRTLVVTCLALPAANTTYYMNATAWITSCSREFNCTITPQLVNVSSSVAVGELTSGTTSNNQQGQQGGLNTSGSTNRTVFTTQTGIVITLPAAFTLQGTQTVRINLNNTNASLQGVTANISELGDYLHFTLNQSLLPVISGNSTSWIDVTFTPFKWVKPGTYLINVTVNSAQSNFTVTVPQPSDSKEVHRYVEVKKDKTKSVVTLAIKNKNSYSVAMNVTENISKQLAQNMAAINITSNINYTIVSDDPVILWSLNLSAGQEKLITYILSGNLGNSNLFTDPTTNSTKISSGGIVLDTTTIIIIIVTVLIVAGGAGAYYFFFMRKRAALPAEYAAHAEEVGETGKAKILEKLKSLPSAVIPIINKVVKGVNALFKKIKIRRKGKEQETGDKTPQAQKPKEKPSKEELIKKLSEVYKK